MISGASPVLEYVQDKLHLPSERYWKGCMVCTMANFHCRERKKIIIATISDINRIAANLHTLSNSFSGTSRRVFILSETLDSFSPYQGRLQYYNTSHRKATVCEADTSHRMLGDSHPQSSVGKALQTHCGQPGGETRGFIIIIHTFTTQVDLPAVPSGSVPLESELRSVSTPLLQNELPTGEWKRVCTYL